MKRCLFALFCGLVVSCVHEPTVTEDQVEPAREHQMVAGASEQEAVDFQVGRQAFLEEESALDGLGPLFNGTSCASCHAIPAVGGAGVIAIVRAGHANDDGTFDPLGDTSLIFLFSTRPDIFQPSISPLANRIGRRRSPTTQGSGLLEAVADATLLALADRQDIPVTVRGRTRLVLDRSQGDLRVGRLGWKAQHATLRSAAAEAYRDELGITNELYPQENAPNDDPQLLAAIDSLRDPEARKGSIDQLARFMRFLAPPAPAVQGPVEQTGRMVFTKAQCDHCHVPRLQTGENASPALHRVELWAYSDLLLHRVGTGDGIADEGSDGEEFRTPPLWGLRFRAPYLHDGSAPTLELAIAAHGQQASSSRDAYQALSAQEQAALLAFLRSL